MLSKDELEFICKIIKGLNDNEPLNGDDIEQITRALEGFNGEDSKELPIKVYFQDKKGISSDLVATFDTEEIYDECFPSLKAMADRSGEFITESIE